MAKESTGPLLNGGKQITNEAKKAGCFSLQKRLFVTKYLAALFNIFINELVDEIRTPLKTVGNT